MTIGQSRISYEDLEDVYVLREGSRTEQKPDKKQDKSSTGLFLKLKNKQTFCINQSNYSIDIRVANMIRKGLGYCTDEEGIWTGSSTVILTKRMHHSKGCGAFLHIKKDTLH